jgi:cell division protein FtsL
MSALARPAARRAPVAPSRGRQAAPPPDQRRSPLRVVSDTALRPRRDRRLLAIVGGGLLFASTLAGNVAIQAQTTQGQFELERLETRARQRQADYQELRLQVAELEAPRRILEHARQMGMIEPARVTYLTPTTKTSTPVPVADHATDGASTTEAAQGWADVKPHLDRRP